MWTSEKISQLSIEQIKTLQHNARSKNALEIIALCENEIALRRPTRETKSLSEGSRSKQQGEIVTEFHFVCRDDKGVIFNPDGTFWTCSWVVAEEVLKESIKYDGRLALHNSKQELSYRQGLIVGYRLVDDFEEGEVSNRIDFLVKSDEKIMEWAGTGTGEKGYRRSRRAEHASKTEVKK